MPRTDHIIPLIIAALFASPMLAAWLAQSAWQPHLGNYGELLGPDAPAFASLAGEANPPAALKKLRGKWLLVTVASGGCDAVCRHDVHLVRQARLAQGRDQSRLERILIGDRTAAMPEDAGLYRLTLPHDRLLRMTNGHPDLTYVIDPLGHAVLRFPENPDGRGMIRDLQRLLRASQIG